MPDQVLDHYFISDYNNELDFEKLSKQNPEVTLAWVRLMKEVGDAKETRCGLNLSFRKAQGFYPHDFLELSKNITLK